MAPEEIVIMRMSELSRRSGLGKPIIHYYLRKGYLHAPIYKQANQAIYDQTHLDKLALLKRAKKKGIPLSYSDELWRREGGKKIRASGPAYPRQAGSSTRDRIVQIASRVFLKKGYRNTTITEIMDNVGITKASFYYYFENKKDLYFVCLDDIFHMVFDPALEEIKQEKDPLQRWQKRWMATRNFYPEMITLMQLIKESLRHEDDEHRRRAAAILQISLIEPLTKDLQRAVEAGAFRKVESNIIVFAILSLIDTFSFRPLMDERYSEMEIEREVFDFILHGLMNPL